MLRLWLRSTCVHKGPFWARGFSQSARRAVETPGTRAAPRTPHNADFMPDVGGGSVPYTINKELPNPLAGKRQQRLYFGLFCATMALSLLGMVKYEAATSPIVSSTVYTLRRSKLAHEYMGDGIRFASSMPWISGNTGIAQKDVDFTYNAVGSLAPAKVHFHAEKVPGEFRYRVLEWSITLEGGETVDLLNEDFHPTVPGPKEEPGMHRAR